jgi:nicotinamide mononucleotide transporter PnuC
MVAAFATLSFFGVRVSWLDFFGSFLTIMSLMLMRRENPWGLVVGLISSVILGAYFAIIGLDGQFISRIFFGMMSCLSIYYWIKKDKKTGKTKIRPTFSPAWILALTAVGWVAITVFFGIWAGLIAALDFTVMYLNVGGKFFLIKKKAEGWLMWNIGDVFEILLFSLSGSYMQLTKTLLTFPNNIIATVKWFRKDKETKCCLK